MIGHVYKLWFEGDEEENIYVGSTIQDLKTRFKNHRYAPAKGCCELYKRFGKDAMRIEELERSEYTDVCDLREREQFFIDKLKPSMNQVNALSTCDGKENCKKYRCKICKRKKYICEHNRRRYRCKECNDFTCFLCDKSFATKKTLTHHLLKHNHKQFNDLYIHIHYH